MWGNEINPPFHLDAVVEHEFTDADLEAYLDEMLDPSDAAEVEQALREEETLLQRLSHINSRRDAGIHTLGEIWRRNQIGVPTAEEMGKYLQGTLGPDPSAYIEFRLKSLKCRYTIAMLRDLEQRQSHGDPAQSESRRRKYFDSSAGLLKRND
ncbi:MAG: hypothetical protein MK108_08000 [Mariniblastus sp.]|nr:hypothetical protein [Mariniblastus sp.]